MNAPHPKFLIWNLEFNYPIYSKNCFDALNHTSYLLKVRSPDLVFYHSFQFQISEFKWLLFFTLFCIATLKYPSQNLHELSLCFIWVLSWICSPYSNENFLSQYELRTYLQAKGLASVWIVACFFKFDNKIRCTGIPRLVQFFLWSPGNCTIGKTALIGDWFRTKIAI